MKRIFSIYTLLLFSHLLPAQDQLQAVKSVLEDLKNYQYGLPETWKPDLLEAMQPVYDHEQLQKQIEPLMLDFLLSNASLPAKRAIGKELAAIASPEAEKSLFKLLADQKAAALALEILAMADLGEVKQFEKALKKADTDTRIGIINLLGDRGENDAVALLARQAKTAKDKESEAIAFALAKIGTPDAASVLHELNVQEDIKNQARVNCGFNLIEKGYKKEGGQIFGQVYQESVFPPLQTAALNGMFAISDQPVDFIKQYLISANEPLKNEVIRLVIKLPENYQSGKELLSVENLTSRDKRQLITILAQRQDRSIHEQVISFLQQENDPLLRKTTLEVIPAIGGASDVELLARLASRLKGEEKQLAEYALFTLPGKDVDHKIIQLLESNNEEIKPVLIKAIGQRNMQQGSKKLFLLASTDNKQIRIEAIEALGKVAGEQDLPAAIALLSKAEDRRERRTLEETVYLIAARSDNRSANSNTIKKELKRTTNTANQISLLSILGQLANPEDYSVMAGYLQHENPEVQSALLRAWEQWPDNQPLTALEGFLKTTDDARQHALAMKSYLQIIDINENMDTEAKLLKLDLAHKFAQHLMEKRMVIAGYAKIHEPASLTKLMGMMVDKEVSAETEAAIQEVSRHIWENNEWVITQLEKIIKISANEKFIAQLKEEINRRTN